MYLFTRTTTARPERALDAAGWAVDVAAQVTSITGIEVGTWSALYGAPLNSVTWTCQVESHAEMGTMGEKLQADPGYVARTPEAADLFEGAPTDSLIEVLGMVGSGGHTGGFASLVSAQCAGGKIGAAATWGMQIFEHVGSVTGRDGIFGRSAYGPWATLGWITLASSLDEVDAAQAAMAADARYLEMVDESGDLFLPGSGQAVLSQRIA
jgi:hypothetical protein